jgi:dTDP-4-amino-4,6-dideoxygalactose transaminase
MMDMQAALGLGQLRRVEGNWRRREAIWNEYLGALSKLPVELPAPVGGDMRHAHHLFTILVDAERTGVSRDDFLDRMTYHGIGVGVHYVSIPEHPYYQKVLGWRPQDFPHAMRIGRQTVSLPISAKLSRDDVRDVIKAVSACLRAR